jgi:hypothetical protein
MDEGDGEVPANKKGIGFLGSRYGGFIGRGRLMPAALGCGEEVVAYRFGSRAL